MSQLDEIQSDVKEVNTKMDRLTEWKGAIEQRCQDRGETISGFKQTLFGNPEKQDGIVSKVQTLMNCKKQITSRKEWVLNIAGGVLKWVIVVIIIWLLMMWKTH